MSTVLGNEVLLPNMEAGSLTSKLTVIVGTAAPIGWRTGLKTLLIAGALLVAASPVSANGTPPAHDPKSGAHTPGLQTSGQNDPQGCDQKPECKP